MYKRYLSIFITAMVSLAVMPAANAQISDTCAGALLADLEDGGACTFGDKTFTVTSDGEATAEFDGLFGGLRMTVDNTDVDNPGIIFSTINGAVYSANDMNPLPNGNTIIMNEALQWTVAITDPGTQLISDNFFTSFNADGDRWSGTDDSLSFTTTQSSNSSGIVAEFGVTGLSMSEDHSEIIEPKNFTQFFDLTDNSQTNELDSTRTFDGVPVIMDGSLSANLEVRADCIVLASGNCDYTVTMTIPEQTNIFAMYWSQEDIQAPVGALTPLLAIMSLGFIWTRRRAYIS